MKNFTLILLVCFSLTIKAQNEVERYTIKNISVNNSYSNFGTTFYGSDKIIFSAPAKRNYIINNVWKGNNQPFLELYEGTISTNGELTNVKKFSNKVNTKYHESNVTFTKDLKTVYFTRSNYFNGRYGKDSLGENKLKLFKATVGENNQWSNIESLPFNNDNYSVGHPTLSEDQKTLYFVSDMPGTMGKTDIFKVSINDDGSYGKPVNLGPDVNTVEREMFPYIDGNDELYYSTDGREGLGMLDIYMSKLMPNGILSPVHLGNNMNSPKDDYAFIINKEKREGYFSSNRAGGKGDDDIYYFKEDIPAVIVCDQTINVLVKNKKTGEVMPDAFVKITSNEDILIDNLTTNEEGLFKFNANCLTNYKITGSKRFFIENSKLVKTTNQNNIEQTVILELLPDEFIVVRDRVMIDINTIYFDYDKYNIRHDAALELDKVVAIMKKYPELKVESGSHTDSRGPDSYNDILSDKRAKATVEYIISKGITPDRISGKGYGEKQLTNKCSNGVRCPEDAHQLNRRTEFVIINPEVIN